MIKVAPSILSANFAYLADEVKKVEESGADYLHIDVMDGHFVPNITCGPVIISALRPHSKLIFDIHLMIEEPDKYIDNFIKAGADLVTVHAEACSHLHRTLMHIKENGIKAGVAFNPATSPSCLRYVSSLIDLVLIMTVNPGFGGQSFIPDMVKKVTDTKKMLESAGCSAEIEVDGGINQDKISLLVKAGATVVVAGTAVFGSSDPARAVREIKEAALRK